MLSLSEQVILFVNYLRANTFSTFAQGCRVTDSFTLVWWEQVFAGLF